MHAKDELVAYFKSWKKVKMMSQGCFFCFLFFEWFCLVARPRHLDFSAFLPHCSLGFGTSRQSGAARPNFWNSFGFGTFLERFIRKCQIRGGRAGTRICRRSSTSSRLHPDLLETTLGWFARKWLQRFFLLPNEYYTPRLSLILSDWIVYWSMTTSIVAQTGTFTSSLAI